MNKARLGDCTQDFDDRYYRPDRVQYRVMLRRHNEAGASSTIDEFWPAFEE